MHTWGKVFGVIGAICALVETVSGGIAGAGGFMMFLFYLVFGPILAGAFCYVFGMFLYVGFIKKLFGLD